MTYREQMPRLVGATIATALGASTLAGCSESAPERCFEGIELQSSTIAEDIRRLLRDPESSVSLALKEDGIEPQEVYVGTSPEDGAFKIQEWLTKERATYSSVIRGDVYTFCVDDDGNVVAPEYGDMEPVEGYKED